jgi:hypothetical protein
MNPRIADPKRAINRPKIAKIKKDIKRLESYKIPITAPEPIPAPAPEPIPIPTPEPAPKPPIAEELEDNLLDQGIPEILIGKSDNKIMKIEGELITKNIEFINIVDRVLSTNKSAYKSAEFNIKINKEFKDKLNLDGDVAKDLKDARFNFDFVPTPFKILDIEPFNLSMERSEHILDPTAGLGAMLNYIRIKNPLAQKYAIEYYEPFVRILRHMNPDTIINDGSNDGMSFLTYLPDKPIFDCILMNPPYSNKGDKRFYVDFLFHSLYIMNKTTAIGEKYINIVCPSLGKDNKKIDASDYLDILKYVGKAKALDIIKRYKKDVNAKYIDALFKGDEDYYSEIDELFGYDQAQFLGNVDFEVGTKITAQRYQFILLGSRGGYIKSKFKGCKCKGKRCRC